MKIIDSMDLIFKSMSTICLTKCAFYDLTILTLYQKREKDRSPGLIMKMVR